MISPAGGAGQDVTINLRLVADPNNKRVAGQVAAEGMAAYKKVESAADKAATQQQKAAEKAATAMEREVRKAAAAADKAAQQEAKAAEKAASEKQKADEKVFRNRAKLLSQIAKDEARAQSASSRAIEQAQQKYESFTEKQFGANKQLGEGSAKATRGVLDMAQGFAILGITSEENLQAFVKAWAKIEAGFKIAKGGLDVVVGLAEAMRAYRVATLAAAAAQEALAVTQAHAARTGVGSAAGSAASGVAGGAAGRVAGTVGVGAAASGVSLTGVASTSVIALAAVEVAQFLARSLGLKNEWTKSRTGQLGAAIGGNLGGWWAGDGGNAAREAQLQRQRDFINEQVQRQNAQAGFNAEVVAHQRSMAERAGAGSLRAFNLNELQEARAGVVAARASDRPGAVRLTEEINALERLKSAQDAILSTDQQRVEALKQQADQMKQNVQQARDQLKVAGDLVKAERERFEGTAAKFGRMDAASQNEIRRIADKRASGQGLTESDARILDKIGLGGKESEKFFAGRVSAEDRTRLGVLGEQDSLKEAQHKQIAAALDLSQAKARETEITQKLLEARQTELETVRQFNNTMQKLFELNSEQRGLDLPKVRQPVEGGNSGATGRFREAAQNAAGEIAGNTDEMIRAFELFSREVANGQQKMRHELDRQRANLALNQA